MARVTSSSASKRIGRKSPPATASRNLGRSEIRNKTKAGAHHRDIISSRSFAKQVRGKASGRIRLVAFDLDGVLIDTGSSWRSVHKHFGTHDHAGMEKYLSGELDDEGFMRWDISLWRKGGKEVHISEVEKVLKDVPFIPGAREAVAKLHEAGIHTAIISGGIDIAAEKAASELGIPIVMANGLEIDSGGYLTGNGILKVPLLDKGTVLRSIMLELGISPETVASVGNSRFDCSMFMPGGVNIAFDPEDDVIAKEAGHVIREKDLRGILKFLI